MRKSTEPTGQIMSLVEKLLSFSPRQEENETACAEFIKKELVGQKMPIQTQQFTTRIPHIEKASLVADGEIIECAGCSFVSGEIDNADNIVSSLADASAVWTEPNINFNPRCPEISRSYYYWSPALAVKPGDLSKLIKAKHLKGRVEVKPIDRPAENILVGNTKTPSNLVIAHYDSIETGATDNASGTAVVMAFLLEHPELTKDNLFVFSADEELSYDKPYYWGHGFRMLEMDYEKVMDKCQKIIVVDSVGNGNNVLRQDEYLVTMAFPIKNLDRWKNKISICCGNIDRLLSVYHSKLDTSDQLQEKYLRQAAVLLQALLS